MIKRHHLILACVLVAQVVLSVVVFWPRASTAGQRELLFPDVEAQEVTSLTIEDGEGNVIELAKVTGDWVLPGADDYPAKGDAVSSFLDKLLAVTTGRLVTQSDTSHKRLQVAPDEFVRRISFETGDGTEATLYLGSSPQFGAMHFRQEGQSETYLTGELTSFDANANAGTWIDTSYQSVTQEDVTRMTLENSNGTFVFEKDDEGNWTLADLAEDETLDETQVTSVLRRAATVTLKAPLGREERLSYGVDAPNAVVALETGDKTVTLRVGAKDADAASYVVKSSESPYYVHVSEFSVKALVENGRDAFLKEPPTPEADSSES
ncbi:MAG: DUF4340 domain-containing protein [Anaerolineae bacterium]|jgi:hypothetical protein